MDSTTIALSPQHFITFISANHLAEFTVGILADEKARLVRQANPLRRRLEVLDAEIAAADGEFRRIAQLPTPVCDICRTRPADRFHVPVQSDVFHLCGDCWANLSPIHKYRRVEGGSYVPCNSVRNESGRFLF